MAILFLRHTQKISLLLLSLVVVSPLFKKNCLFLVVVVVVVVVVVLSVCCLSVCCLFVCLLFVVV